MKTAPDHWKEENKFMNWNKKDEKLKINLLHDFLHTCIAITVHQPVFSVVKQFYCIDSMALRSMVKSNVMWANDLTPLLADDIPSHKSWLTISMRFIVLFDWHLQQTFPGVVDLDQQSKSTHTVYLCRFLSLLYFSPSLPKIFLSRSFSHSLRSNTPSLFTCIDFI